MAEEGPVCAWIACLRVAVTMNNEAAAGGGGGRVSPSLSSVGTDEAAVILQAVDLAEWAGDNAPLPPSGGAGMSNPLGGEECSSLGNVSARSNPPDDFSVLEE